MNQQYMQQPQQQQQQQQPQPPHFGGPQGAPPYESLNSNAPTNMMKSPMNPSNFPPQKTMQGPPPPSNIPLSQNTFYNYSGQGDGRQVQQSSSPAPQINQANLTNQMSNMALNNPPAQQNFPPQPTNNMAVPPGNRNGYNGPPPPSHQINSGPQDAMLAGPPQARPGLQGPPPHGPTPPASSAQSLPPTQPPANQFNRYPNEPHQTSNQLQAQRPPAGSTNINSVPSPTQTMNFPSPNQPRVPGQPYMAQNMSGPQQNIPGHQQNMSGPQQNIPGHQQNMSGPQQNIPGHQQNIPGHQQNMSGPQQNMSGPQQNIPGPQQNMSGHQQNMSGHQQNMSGPIHQNMPGPQQNIPGPLQNMSGPPQQNMSGPPMPPGQSNISGPPLPGQSGPYNVYQVHGQSNIPGTIPGMPQNQNPIMAQRPMMSGPPLAGRQQPPFVPGGQPGFQNPYPQQQPQQQQQQQQQPYLNMPGAPSPGFQPGTQPQQAKRLDPETMPSPIQVMQEDQRTRGGAFITNQRGLVPPFVTTKFVVQDQGNASPRFIRSTIYTVPTTTDIMKQTGVPFGLILNPMAQVGENEQEPPIVDMGEVGPVRCIRCKAYMSPFMQFIDAGRRFQCSFCRATTEVPTEYFQHLDHTGQRVDRYERPELMLGTYEFIATKDYCRENTFPKPPAIVFIIDVSYNTVKSGLVHLICAEMKRIIKHLPKDTYQERTNMKVGFITYSNTVHFYNISPNLTQPQMMVVGDTQDVFMPLLDGFLCDPEESEAVIDSLMAQIPEMFAETRETETILAPAIQAGLEALKASNCTGKLMVFHSSLPIAEAPGKLKNRDDRKVLATDKEKTVLAPQNNVYNNLGQSCVGAGCSVDLFIFNNSYVDIATIGQVCRLTGGEVYKYTYFQADVDGDRLVTDVINNISRPIAFDAVMRVRTSTGVRPTDFYGHFFMSNTTDIELASVDCNKAVAVEVKHDDKLSEEEGVYIQVALLYTSCGGVRRLRIINLSLRTSSQMAELYRACDPDAVINFFSKQSVFKLIESSPKAVKDHLISRCATILGAYRKHCASPFSASQLVLPECMKLLPLYVNCLLKSDAISGGADMTIDDRSYVMMAVATMPVHTSVIYFYPRLLPLHDIDPQEDELPQQLRCSIDKFMDDGAYLLENGIHMFLWLGLALPTDWIQAVFGTPVVDSERTSLPVLDTPLNKRIREIITRIRAERHHCMRLTIVRQREKLEMVLRHFLVEDRGNDSSPSYIDFLCHMHKEIKTLLSQ